MLCVIVCLGLRAGAQGWGSELGLSSQSSQSVTGLSPLHTHTHTHAHTLQLLMLLIVIKGGTSCTLKDISPMIRSMKSTHGSVPFKHGVVRLYIGISPMITSMKSTHGSVPFKHSVVRLYIGISPMITSMKSTYGSVPFTQCG